MGSIRAIILKEFQQLRQDPIMLRLIILLPIIQLLILGTAISVEVKNLPIAILDFNKTTTSRELSHSLFSNDYLQLYGEAQNIHEVENWLQSGRIKAALIIGSGMQNRVFAGGGVRLQTLVDGVDGNAALIANNYINAALQRYLQSQITAAPISGQQQALAEVNPVYLFNPDLRPSWHYVPGIMALLTTIISMLLTAFSLVKEKESGTYEQLLVTPVGKFQFIAGKITPFFILTLFVLALSLLIIWLIYGITLNGSIVALLLGTTFYLLASLGIGLFISTVTQTQQQALFLTWFILIFAILMADFLFPVDNMPAALQNLAALNPLMYFVRILRGTLVKGAVFADLLKPLQILGILGVLAMLASFFGFKK
jgi:ABC-2 type transport system permease protein